MAASDGVITAEQERSAAATHRTSLTRENKDAVEAEQREIRLLKAKHQKDCQNLGH